MPSGAERPRGSLERVLRRRPPGQKGARHVWGSSEERNPLREEGTKSFAIASLAPSLARTAKRKNPSNRIQNRQLKSWTDGRTDGRADPLLSFLRSFDRSDAVFARPLTPLFKGFQNAAAAAAAAGRVLSALVVPNDQRPKKGINPLAPAFLLLRMISIGSDSPRL